jgi:hypothetical protein
MTAPVISPHDRIRLAAQAIVHPRTVLRVYAGTAQEMSRLRVEAAARHLGLPLPPMRSACALPESPNTSKAA